MISVEQEPPTMAEAQELLVQSEAFSAALYPPESCHIASVDDLSGDSARFFIARTNPLVAGVEPKASPQRNFGRRSISINC